MSLILALVLIVVILIVIDIFRKSIRSKQKFILAGIEEKSNEALVALANNDLSLVQDVFNEYPLLKDGYLVLYYETASTINIKDLSSLLKRYNIKFTDENVFQKINYNDVIFSILADNEKQAFESQNEGSVSKIVAVMNFKKLATFDYDIKACYESIMDVLDDVSKSYGGTIMNENRIRLTNKDKQNYLESII